MTMPSRMPEPYGQGGGANLADILERVLDKGIVIAGDIRINLLDIELLTIKLRLIVASVDKAKEMGIDWWEDDPALSSGARRKELARENAELRAQVAELEQATTERRTVERGKSEQSSTERGKAKQSKTEHSKTEHGKTAQSESEEST
ncbi:gas vesicle protein [Streptomyces longisporoflavus]|uniref:Gas vesicle protein n=1 Tax=Streptomyces longisporoflavus TaxID=28044 RepID=A0ABW7QHY8_9ACTN